MESVTRYIHRRSVNWRNMEFPVKGKGQIGKKSDYNKYDYLIGMEERNRKNMLRILGKDPKKKVSLLLDYADEHGDIADPWYTGNFDITYRDVVRGCEGFLTYLEGKGQIIMN